jgi:hypothetical protein
MKASKPSGGRLALLLQLLFALSVGRTARADETGGRPIVIVLRPSQGPLEGWAEGTQAVVAELVAGGYELTLRSSSARDRAEAVAELERSASAPGIIGGVLVIREGELGVAYVWTREAGTVRIEAGVAAGAVGEGELALRTRQLLGPARIDFEKPAVVQKPVPPPSTPPLRAPRAAPADTLLAFQAGLAFSSDLTEPLPVAGLTVQRGLFGSLSIEASGWLTLGASRLETPAGSVDITSQELRVHASFEPVRQEKVALSLGLGGGVVWVHGDGVARASDSVAEDSTRVGVVSARATVTLKHDDLRLLLGFEPGVTLPAVSISAADESIRLGRPWTLASVGLGWSF